MISYHKLGHKKYRLLGKEPPDEHIELIDKEILEKVKHWILKEGLKAIIII